MREEKKDIAECIEARERPDIHRSFLAVAGTVQCPGVIPQGVRRPIGKAKVAGIEQGNIDLGAEVPLSRALIGEADDGRLVRLPAPRVHPLVFDRDAPGVQMDLVLRERELAGDQFVQVAEERDKIDQVLGFVVLVNLLLRAQKPLVEKDLILKTVVMAAVASLGFGGLGAALNRFGR